MSEYLNKERVVEGSRTSPPGTQRAVESRNREVVATLSQYDDGTTEIGFEWDSPENDEIAIITGVERQLGPDYDEGPDFPGHHLDYSDMRPDITIKERDEGHRVKVYDHDFHGDLYTSLIEETGGIRGVEQSPADAVNDIASELTG